jgi:hypothetical protein
MEDKEMFEIRFRGLMTHATVPIRGQDQQVVAVYAVADPPHIPLVSVPTAFIDTANTTATPVATTEDVTCYALTGHVETNITGGTGSLPTKALAGLPKVTDIYPGTTINPDVLALAVAGTTGLGEIAAVILLPHDGNLIIANWFEEQATIDRKTANCIPQTIVFQSPFSGNVIIIIGNAQVALHADAFINVSNISEKLISSGTNHSIYNAFFFASPDLSKVTPIRSAGLLCSWAANYKFAICSTDQDLSVECADTQYP